MSAELTGEKARAPHPGRGGQEAGGLPGPHDPGGGQPPPGATPAPPEEAYAGWSARLTALAAARGVRVDPEFRDFLPHPGPEEVAQLEAALLEGTGDRGPVYRWEGEGVLLDGHWVLLICLLRGLPFSVADVGLPDKRAALDWRLQRQTGRRNLTPLGASYLRGRAYNAAKQGHGGSRPALPSSDQTEHLKTCQALAARFRVSEATVRRDGEFAGSVDAIAGNCGEGARRLVLSGDCQLDRGQVAAWARARRQGSEKTSAS